MNILLFGTIADYIKKEINHKCGLNLSQTRILLFFNGNKNTALTMGQLANSLNISISTLSRQLKQKRTKLLIKIIPSDKNSSKQIQLNQNGLNKINELLQCLDEIENLFLSNLDEDKGKQFSQQLKILTQKLNLA